MVCFDRFSFSGGGRVTSYSGEFGEILFKHRQVRCKKKHILPPTGGNFTSEAIAERLHKRNEMERLHKQGFRSLVKM